MRERRIRAGQVELAVAEAVPDGPPKGNLLIVHGFTGGKGDFTDWLDRIAAEGWHVVVPDHRGHGDSDKPDREDDYSFEILADDMDSVVASLGWDRYAMLGFSLGGMVAQVMALRNPAPLAGLILQSSHHGPVETDADRVELGKSLVRNEGIEALWRGYEEHGSPLTTPAHQRLVVERPGYKEFGDKNLLSTAPAAWVALVEASLGSEDRLADLATIRVPTLVIGGEQDHTMIEASTRIAATIPDARLEVVEGAGHAPQWEAPEAWWAVMAGFLAEVAS